MRSPGRGAPAPQGPRNLLCCLGPAPTHAGRGAGRPLPTPAPAAPKSAEVVVFLTFFYCSQQAQPLLLGPPG
eukprot:2777680-Alexandrium_andersonii.AAC.1